MIKMTKDAAMYAVFHDLSNPSEGEHWLPHLGKQSVGAMWSEQTYEAFRVSMESVTLAGARLNRYRTFPPHMCFATRTE